MNEQKTDRYFGTLTHIAGPIYEVDPGSVILTLVTLAVALKTVKAVLWKMTVRRQRRHGGPMPRRGRPRIETEE